MTCVCPFSSHAFLSVFLCYFLSFFKLTKGKKLQIRNNAYVSTLNLSFSLYHSLSLSLCFSFFSLASFFRSFFHPPFLAVYFISTYFLFSFFLSEIYQAREQKQLKCFTLKSLRPSLSLFLSPLISLPLSHSLSPSLSLFVLSFLFSFFL